MECRGAGLKCSPMRTAENVYSTALRAMIEHEGRPSTRSHQCGSAPPRRTGQPRTGRHSDASWLLDLFLAARPLYARGMRIAIFAALLAAVSGCDAAGDGQSSDLSVPCPASCGDGFVCDPITHYCVVCGAYQEECCDSPTKCAPGFSCFMGPPGEDKGGGACLCGTAAGAACCPSTVPGPACPSSAFSGNLTCVNGSCVPCSDTPDPVRPLCSVDGG